MNRKRIFRLLTLGGLGLMLGATALHAAPPWANWDIFKKVEADPQKSYALTESNGPWLIMACSFSGKGAEEQAQNLVIELRKRYKLPAYVHRARFNLEDVQGRGVNRYGAPPKMRYRHGNEIDEIAVLVGDYHSIDDAEGQKVLKKLKFTTPRCLEVKTDNPTNQTLAGWRKIQQDAQSFLGSDQKNKGPMGHAFITRNPLLPEECFASKGLDPLVLDMNKNVKHSLLDCPGKYSVQVATFKGQVLIDQKKIAQIERGEKSFDSGLAEAALKAHQLTEALRMKGYEAYEFHDRYASIVTVGSFDTVGTPLPDGRIDLHPTIVKIMRTFGTVGVEIPGKAGPQTAVQSLAGINFDIQPIPVIVPKRSISAEINRTALTR
ncbi:MAG: hypothetical protein JXB10_13950 [Pirellulales bacterium]|nr:hypothetical protein [Pirellulales bacterium]